MVRTTFFKVVRKKRLYFFFENKTFYILLFRNERCLLCIENSFSENVLVSKVNVYF